MATKKKIFITHTKKIFISHSSQDKELVQHFRSLLPKLIDGLSDGEILCSSTPGGGIAPGSFINTQLIKQARNCPVFIAILTPSYFDRLYCVAEFYARMGSGKALYPFHLSGTKPESFGPIAAGMNMTDLGNSAEVIAVMATICRSSSQNWQLGNTQACADGINKLGQYRFMAKSDVQELREKLVANETETGLPYLNACGLMDGLRADGLIQDFELSGLNKEPVQFLWADSRSRNTISTYIGDEKEKPYLGVRFEHKGGFGCNLSIRSRDEKAVDARKFSRLSIDARVGKPPPDAEVDADSYFKEIGIRIRLVNGFMQHWELLDNPQDLTILRIANSEFWTPIIIDLHKSFWGIFHSDGTGLRGPEKPDFSIIASINIALGGYDHIEATLLKGRGVLEVNEIRLLPE